jgi:excisionase family DNA binding protein
MIPALAQGNTMTSDTSPRPKLRTREAAAYTGLAKSTLEKLRVSGGGAPYIRIGRVVLYDLDDLDAWLSAHRRKSTSD